MSDLTQPVKIALEVTKLDLLKFIVPTVASFTIGILSTPLIMKFLVKNDMQKKKNVSKTIDGRKATLTSKIDNDEGKTLYRMGGLVMLSGVFGSALIIWIISKLTGSDAFIKLDFISRNQTWLIFFALAVGAITGFIDDLMVCGKTPKKLQRFSKYVGDGLSFKFRITVVSLLAAFCGWWIAVKQENPVLHVPFFGNYTLPVVAFIALFILVVIATYSGNIIDGVDGMSGGVFSTIFAAFGILAITQGKYDIATFCFAMIGGLFAFLWFNIPPARFMLSEVGSMGITIIIGILAFLTDSVLVLPVIAGLMVITVASVVIQLTSKKLRGGKKVFLAAPIHIHLQLIGWPKPKVAMRYWILSLMFATSGVAIYLLGGNFR
jgi:phospho-N-acetylmuramoyl-pentapeptide-transferase